jgi:hypothetical protein
MEEKRNLSNKAFFQLRDRLARQKVSHPNASGKAVFPFSNLGMTFMLS